MAKAMTEGMELAKQAQSNALLSAYQIFHRNLAGINDKRNQRRSEVTKAWEDAMDNIDGDTLIEIFSEFRSLDHQISDISNDNMKSEDDGS